MKVKKGDNVIVLTGKDKGRKGKVVRALPKKNKVIIDGINVFKKTQRPRRNDEKGQLVDVSMPIHVSNVKKVK